MTPRRSGDDRSVRQATTRRPARAAAENPAKTAKAKTGKDDKRAEAETTPAEDKAPSSDTSEMTEPQAETIVDAAPAKDAPASDTETALFAADEAAPHSNRAQFVNIAPLLPQTSSNGAVLAVTAPVKHPAKPG